ncbi:MAG: TldD/PmbA family protein [bacterium]|nr:TldD/PmbA family protein [bacterium]
MITETELKTLSETILSKCSGYEAEVMLSSSQNALTRFGENVITQNVASESIGLTVRLIKNGKMGKASTGNISPSGIESCIQAAKVALEVNETDPDLLPLADPQEYQSIDNFVPSTAELTPEARSSGVEQAVRHFRQHQLVGAGIFSNSASNLAIANSKGLWAYNASTASTFSVSAMSEDSSGWAEANEKDVHNINIAALSTIAAKKALDSKSPIVVEPDAWTVVLEPAAVSELMTFLCWFGFNGLAFVENRSCFSGKIGEQVVGSNITMHDHVYHPLSGGMPFDFEGFPRQSVLLIEKGVLKSVVHDRRTAARAGTIHTGHAMPQPDSFGPVPLNLVVEGGDSSLEEMIRTTQKGLLVTRFHYVNLLNPMTLTITGMTRDGLFLIENGEVVKGVKNLRFTESILEALKRVAALSKTLYKADTFWGGGGIVLPAMKIEGFHFTSGTEN